MTTGVRVRVVALAGVVVLLASCAAAKNSPTGTAPSATSTSTPAAGPAVLTPILGSVLAEPVPVPATDGKDHLAYEVESTNALGQDVNLTSLAVNSGDKTLLSLAGDNLAHWTRVLGENSTATTKLGLTYS